MADMLLTLESPDFPTRVTLSGVEYFHSIPCAGLLVADRDDEEESAAVFLSAEECDDLAAALTSIARKIRAARSGR